MYFTRRDAGDGTYRVYVHKNFRDKSGDFSIAESLCSFYNDKVDSFKKDYEKIY